MTTVKAERFLLTDSKGNPRAELAMAADGPVLAFYDEEGKPRVKVGATEAEAGFILYDSDGHKLAQLDAIQPGLILYEEGQVRAALGITNLGGSLALYHDDEKPVAVLGVDAEAWSPALSLYGRNGQLQAKLITAPVGSSRLLLFDGAGDTSIEVACDPTSLGIEVSRNGKVIWKAP